jgi:hypothetical protein
MRDRSGLGSLGSPLAADFSAAEMGVGKYVLKPFCIK